MQKEINIQVSKEEYEKIKNYQGQVFLSVEYYKNTEKIVAVDIIYKEPPAPSLPPMPVSINTYLGEMDLKERLNESFKYAWNSAHKNLNDKYLESLPTCLLFDESPRANITTAEIMEALERGRKNSDALSEKFRNWNSGPYPNIIMR